MRPGRRKKCLATGRQPGRFSENFKSKSRLKIWRSCTPPFDLQSTGDQRGGVHDRQIFSRDFDLKISENPPGCLPVASNVLVLENILRENDTSFKAAPSLTHVLNSSNPYSTFVKKHSNSNSIF